MSRCSSPMLIVAAVAAGLMMIHPADAAAGEVDWYVLGPFEVPEGKAAQDVDFVGGEADLRPRLGRSVNGAEWRKQTVEDGSTVDFNRIYGYRENVVVYACRAIRASRGGEAFLRIGHDDGASAWLNGKRLGRWGIGERELPVQLRRGTNILTVKVDQRTGGFRVFATVEPPIRFSSPIVTPNGDGVNDTVSMQLAIDKPTDASVAVMDPQNRVVRRLAADQPVVPRSEAIRWDGRDDRGKVVESGSYKVVAILADERRLEAKLRVRHIAPLEQQAFAEARSFFPLGVYYDSGLMPDPDQFEEQCRDLVAHGMNTISFTSHGPPLINRNEDHGRVDNPLLAIMDRHGLKGIVGVERANGFFEPATPPSELHALRCLRPIVAEASRYNSVLAYYLTDEPSLDKAQKIHVAARSLEHLDSKRPGIACLIGLDRIQGVYQKAPMPIMYIDPYAVSYGSEEGDFRMSGFGYPHMDLAEYIDYARDIADADAPLWTVIQTHNFQKQLREPTPEEVRAMSWIAVAHGSTGLIWFIYQTEQGWRGLVHEGRTTERYRVASEVAGRIAPIADTLVGLRYSNEVAAKTDTSKAEVQTLVDRETQQRYLVCVNRDVKSQQDVLVKVLIDHKGVRDIARDMQPRDAGDGRFVVSLAPGEGTVLVVE